MAMRTGLCRNCTAIVSPIITRKFFGTKDYSSIYSVVAVAVSVAGVLQAPVLGALLDTTGFTVLQYVEAALAVVAAVFLVLATVSARKVKF